MKKPKTTTTDTKTYTTYSINESFIEDITQFKKYIDNIADKIPFVKYRKKEYANIPISFDIETSSFYEDGEKVAIMYAYTLCINGTSFLGRTWDSFIDLITYTVNSWNLSDTRLIIIYIHNLSYEFQFIRKRLPFNSVFATDTRTPVVARTINGIEFKCSYLLSGYSLNKVGEHLTKYPVKKKIGDLDYRKIRHSDTPLNVKEKGYILNDGLVVTSYIQEQIESHDNNICKIPLTKTGETRILCRNNCLYGGLKSHKKSTSTYRDYHRLMLGLSINSLEEYKQLRERAFMGGFTHANGYYHGDVIKDVTSFDFTSAYPYVMVAEKYPTGRAEHIRNLTTSEFKKSIDKYCCMFDVIFYDLEETFIYEHPLSSSHCFKKINCIEDNGRIVRGEMVATSLTDLDFKIMKKFYKWSRMSVKNFRRYKRDYLPTAFVKTILELYKNKTELKGIEGQEAEYLHSKELLNSCYGMTVTDILRTEVIYKNDEWSLESFESEEAKNIHYIDLLNKYNKKASRFIAYQWGIWVTAYNRYNLFSGIYASGKNYVYSDTDSIKVKNADSISSYIEKYNDNVVIKLKRAMNYHGLDMSLCMPKTKTGEVKILGVWDKECIYSRFKTLGAKRYMTEHDGKISLTVSGINKKTAIPYLQTLGKDLFELFDENMTVKGSYEVIENGQKIIKTGTGKNTHTYIDSERDGIVTDYLGNKSEYHELSAVHMEEADYNLTYSIMYINYLLSIKERKI